MKLNLSCKIIYLADMVMITLKLFFYKLLSYIIKCDETGHVKHQDNLQQYTHLIVDKSCTYLPQGSLDYNWVTKIDLPDTIITIEDDFSHSSITYLFIPASASNISDSNPFNPFYKLLNFEVAYNNPVLKSYKGILFNKDMSKLIQYPLGRKDTTFIVPKSVKSVGFHAFYKNSYIETVLFQNSVDQLERQAFYLAANLSLVGVPLRCNISEFGYQSFEGTKINSNNISYYVPFNVCNRDTCLVDESLPIYLYIPLFAIFLSYFD